MGEEINEWKILSQEDSIHQISFSCKLEIYDYNYIFPQRKRLTLFKAFLLFFFLSSFIGGIIYEV